MKKLFIIIAIGSVLALLVAGTAQAQLPGTSIRAAIPFDFIVRGRTLPAGRYEITRINDDPVELMIRNVDYRRNEAMFSTEAAYVRRSERKDVLVFHRYGDSYFLSEIVTAGENTGRELEPSRTERQLERDMAKNQGQPETVTVALYR